MRSKLYDYWHKSGWRLAVALLLSLLLHVLTLGGLQLHLPTPSSTDHTVEVRLAPITDSMQPHKIARAPAVPMQKHHAAPKPVPEPKPESEPAPLPETPAEAIPSPPATLPEEPVATTPQDTLGENPVAATDALPEPVNESDTQAGEQDESQPEAIVFNGQAYIDMDFDVFRNGDGGTVGAAHTRYEQFDDGRYKLISTTEARGLIRLFISGQLVQTSEGMVTTRGLRPQHFSYEFGDKTEKSQQATFDWEAHTVTMQTSKHAETVPIISGTQDLLSIMYQFMFVPPLQQMQLSFTNGKKLNTYHYQFAGEETLKTKAGEFRTLHIYRTGENGDEKIDLWLAIESRFIPVKIVKTLKDGSSYTQIVSRLSTDILK